MSSAMPEETIQRHIRQLAKGRRSRRASAALLLANCSDSRSETALFQALQDPSALVRVAAVGALINRNDQRPPEPIVDALRAARGQERQPGQAWRHPDAEEMLDYGLTKLKRLQSVEVFSEAVATADDWHIRMLAAMALGQLEDDRAAGPLISALADRDASVRSAAAEALGRLRIDASRPALSQALQDDARRVRRQARIALRQLA